jgi:arsenate reductase-like glutaredoxin family protein
MFNFRSPSFKKIGAAKESLSDDDLLAWMVKEPRLIRRPVVRIGRQVHFGADSRALAALLP